MELKNNIFYVGVQNPDLRIFDITMKTNYGTSYNAYLIKDKEVTLIDTVHEHFWEQYIANITKYVDIQDVKYLVLNHTEPDHSGSIEKLLDINPNIQIYCSSEASKNINEMMNKDAKAHVVKNDEILNIGDRNLTFKLAPFLHWPDSIFTYSEADEVVFTGDFLGSHFSEPKIFDEHILNDEEYLENAIYYYECIFSPFTTFVDKGLDILEQLKYEYIMPSHGPVLKEKIQQLICMYKEYNFNVKEDKVAIVYASAYGYTESLARIAAEYIKDNSKYCVKMLDVNKHELGYIKEEIETAKALLIGSPTINRDAVKPIWDVLSVIDVYRNRGLVAGVFGSYAWSGEAVNMIKNRLSLLCVKVVEEGIRVKFKPNTDDIKAMQEYTQKVISEIK